MEFYFFRNLDGTSFDLIDFNAINGVRSIQAIYFTRFYYCSMTPHIKICMPRSDGMSSLFSNFLISISFLFRTPKQFDSILKKKIQVYQRTRIYYQNHHCGIRPG